MTFLAGLVVGAFASGAFFYWITDDRSGRVPNNWDGDHDA